MEDEGCGLGKLREGGIKVDEYIDALVYTEEATQAEASRARDTGAANTEWPSETASNNDQVQRESIG